ncbi:MAG: hypothetical protein AAF216_02970 [Pseudomonadota bacterium]
MDPNENKNQQPTAPMTSPALTAIVLITNSIDRLLRWIFDFSRVSVFVGFFLCLFAGLIFVGVANSTTAINEPGSIAAMIRSYWIALYGPSETVGLHGPGLKIRIIPTGLLLLLPLWIVTRLVQLPFFVLIKIARQARRKAPS